jgi:hypothetical protein
LPPSSFWQKHREAPVAFIGLMTIRQKVVGLFSSRSTNLAMSMVCLASSFSSSSSSDYEEVVALGMLIALDDFFLRNLFQALLGLNAL